MSDVKVIITGDASGLEREVGRARGALGGLGDVAKFALGSVVANVAMSAASALSGLASSAVSLAADYEQSMAILRAVSGATDAQMQQLRKTAIALGEDITLPGVSAITATSAMTELAKAGLSVEQAMAAARGTLQLAAAGQIDAAAAAEVVAGALNAFNLSGDQATRVADLLAAAANASAADVTDMAYALRMTSAVAALSGQSIEDITTAIGLMANAGIKGSDAGTSLKTMLMRLASPTDEARAAMTALGVSVYDSSGAMRPLPDLVSQFSSALSVMTDEQKQAALTTVFGADAIRAASIVLAAGREQYDALAKAVTRQGAAADLAGAQMTGLKGKLEGVRSQLETLALRAAEPLLEPLSRAIGGLGELLASPQVSEAISAFATSIADALSGAIDWVQANWPTISATMQQVYAALSAVVQWVQTNWPAFEAAIVPIIKNIASIVTEILVPVAQMIIEKLQTVVQWVQTNWPLIEETVRPVLKAVIAIAGIFVAAIVAIFRDGLPHLISIVKSVMEGVSKTIDIALNLILSTVKTILQVLQGDWSGAWQTMQQTGQAIWDSIRGFFSGLPGQLADIGRQMIQGLASGVSQGAGAVRSAVESAVLSAIAAAKSALGIRSPSRVFADIGIQSGKGFIAGLESIMRDVDMAMNALVTPPEVALSNAPSYVTTNQYYLNVTTTRSVDALSQDYRLMRR
jgi:TP901 family phage tail tape measure protein